MADVVQAGAQSLSTWTDLSGFGALRHQAESDSNATLPAVAKQFESIFTQMMLKSMRRISSSMSPKLEWTISTSKMKPSPVLSSSSWSRLKLA